MYYYPEKNKNKNNTWILFAIIAIGLIIYFERNKSKNVDEGNNENNKTDMFYKWTILNADVRLKYMDMTTDDRIESIKIDGDPGAFFVEQKKWSSYGRFRNELTSATGFYDQWLKGIKLYITFTNKSAKLNARGYWYSMDGSLLAISSGIDGYTVGIGSDSKLWRWTNWQTWEKVGGDEDDFSFINVAKNQVFLGLKPDGSIYKSEGNKMVQIPSDGIEFIQASIGTDGSIFAIDKNDNLYKLETTGEWVKLNKKAKMVTHYNNDKIYVINLNDNLEEGLEI